MRPRPASLTCVLGHPRVLDEGAPDAARRVLARRDGHPAGVAAYERLYGPAAEIAVSVDDPGDLGIIRSLVHDIAVRAQEAGLQSMYVAVQPGQEPTVATVLGAPVVDGMASVRLSTPDGSVIPTDGGGQAVPMPRLTTGPIIDP